MTPERAAPAALVIDTNIVLDVFLFADAKAAPLRAAIEQGSVTWLASSAMREELARVLGYAHIVRRMARSGLLASDVLAHFDARATRVEAAAKAPITCKDADDQKFIDLALAHGALLLSKDGEVLRMARRMERSGARCAKEWGAAV